MCLVQLVQMYCNTHGLFDKLEQTALMCFPLAHWLTTTATIFHLLYAPCLNVVVTYLFTVCHLFPFVLCPMKVPIGHPQAPLFCYVDLLPLMRKSLSAHTLTSFTPWI